MANKSNPRREHAGKRDKLRARVAAEGLPCHLCGKPIDYSLPAGHPMAYELDEIIPVSRGGSPIDRENVAPAHRICNQRRGNKDIAFFRQPSDGANGTDRLLHLPLPCSRDWFGVG